MTAAARKIQTTYLILMLLHTLAASFIWGINTLFLLDAGLSNAQAFAANAFFTAGLMLFEVPTGVVADTRGRRVSYLVGSLTLSIATLLYIVLWRTSAPFWAWALTSVFLGLGFTFFSGATQAWLIDALNASGFTGKHESVFAKGKIVEGAAMLAGSVGGGFIAQATNLGVPYILRTVALALSFVIAFFLMRDVGFKPQTGVRITDAIRNVVRGSLQHGLGNPPVRWLMLAAFFTDGVMIYAFYAAQPYLLQLWGDPNAYGIAGIAAAVFASAQIAGGFLVPVVSRLVRRRTTFLLIGVVGSAAILAAIGSFPRFGPAIALLGMWGLLFATIGPVRQAYLNGLIASEHRATVLSFDSLLGSSGGVVAQPILGRVADVWNYPASYLAGAAIQALAIPFVWLARRENATSDSEKVS